LTVIDQHASAPVIRRLMLSERRRANEVDALAPTSLSSSQAVDIGFVAESYDVYLATADRQHLQSRSATHAVE